MHTCSLNVLTVESAPSFHPASRDSGKMDIESSKDDDSTTVTRSSQDAAFAPVDRFDVDEIPSVSSDAITIARLPQSNRSLTAVDLDRLEPGQYLNDAIVNFFLESKKSVKLHAIASIGS
jgi:Ulp1 family protease